MSALLSAGRERAVLHFNVADFAVAVERVADTGLCRRPLLIAPLGAARAVVYDMSEEAYGEGVRKGMPLRRATRLCPRAALLPPRPDLYARAMGAFFRELQGYSPLIEVGDVDGHFFVDVTGTHRLHGPAVDIGWRVRRRARAALGINPIWTLGSGKVVAKVASRLVKPVGEYIVAPGEEEAFLAPLPVRLLPGLSGRELQRLEAFSLTTVGALAELSRQQLLVAFGSRCHYLHGLSHGIDEEPVRPPGAAQEMFFHQHLFADDSNDREEVQAALFALADTAGSALRDRALACRRLVLRLDYADGSHSTRQALCGNGAASDFQLRQLALAALDRAWTRRTRLRACRLACDRLQPRSPQLSLFPEGEERQRREERLQGAIDILRVRYRPGLVGIGRSGVATLGRAGE
jgi:DNA polymerase-4